MTRLVAPLDEHPVQVVASNTAQVHDIIRAVLEQTGRADMAIATFSTSEQFVRSMLALKEEGLAGSITFIADTRAAAKTAGIMAMARQVFDRMVFGRTHMKYVTFHAGGRPLAAIITSQNQTSGYRWEAAVVTTDRHAIGQLTELTEGITHGDEFIDAFGTDT